MLIECFCHELSKLILHSKSTHIISHLYLKNPFDNQPTVPFAVDRKTDNSQANSVLLI